MSRALGALGATSGFLAVAAGAFGAHALRSRLAPDLLAVFETAARYQMYHALALLLVAALDAHRPSALTRAAGWCFVGGTVIFSGSLYALALTGMRTLGAITPIGGLLFLAGWATLVFSCARRT